MISTDIELNRPLSLERISSPNSELSEAQGFYRDPEGKIAGLTAPMRESIAIPTGALFALGSGLSLATLPLGSLGVAFVHIFLALPALGAILGWTLIPEAIWRLRMDRRRKKLSAEISETTAALSSWLQETYGMTFGVSEDAEMLTEGLLRINAPIHELREFTLLTRDGMKIQARIKLTDQGLLELKKAHAADSNESPYFTPIREELS